MLGRVVCMESILDLQFVTLQFPSNLAVFKIAVDRSVTFTVGPGTGLHNKCLLQSQQSDVMAKAELFLETKEHSSCLFFVSNAYLHSPETEYKITDCTRSFYETRKKQGRYLTAGQILHLINSVLPKSSFPCWQVGCA